MNLFVRCDLTVDSQLRPLGERLQHKRRSLERHGFGMHVKPGLGREQHVNRTRTCHVRRGDVIDLNQPVVHVGVGCEFQPRRDIVHHARGEERDRFLDRFPLTLHAQVREERKKIFRKPLDLLGELADWRICASATQ